jgi:sugar/nucleoside kinase (ribokinase family)
LKISDESESESESAFRNVKLCIVGNINRDVKTAPFTAGDYLFKDGETSLSSIHESIGGGGANSAAAAAALGAHCDFVGQIGDDAIGTRLQQALERAGVTCHLYRDAGAATGTTMNLVYDSGQRHFLSWHPNNYNLRFENLDLSPLTRADHLYRADIWFSESMLFGGNRRLLEEARKAGVATSLDLNWDPAWGRESAATVGQRRNAVREILSLVDLVHGNIRELCEFTNSTDMGVAVREILECGAGAVVVHMGAQGAGYFSRDESIIEPSCPVERQVTSTGTGDVLSVCMMLLHRHPSMAVPDRLRLANRIVGGFIEGRRKFIPAL